jgi:hypothetical protein
VIYFYLGFFLFLLLAIFSWGVQSVLNACLHATDFSIYQEAIYRIADFQSLNPYLYIRDLNIFNDHFDPIFLAAVPWVRLWNYHPISLIIFELSWLLASLVFIFKKTPGDWRDGLFFALLFVLSKGVLTGIHFPIHPSTWSMFAILLWAYCLKKGRLLGIVLSTLFLFSFREVFPIAVAISTLPLWIKKRYREAVPITLLSLLFIAIIFTRPLWLGPTHSYAGQFLKSIIENPLLLFSFEKLKAFFKLFFPFIFVAIYLWKYQREEVRLKFRENPFLWQILFFSLPLIALHTVMGKVHFQYGPFLVTPLFCLLWFLYRPSSPKINAFFLIAFLLGSMGTITKFAKTGLAGKSKTCSIGENKRQEIKMVQSLLGKVRPEKKILATGGIIPNILKPHLEIYQAGKFSVKLDQYDYLILDRVKSGDIYPLSAEQLQQTIDRCHGQELFSGKHFLVLYGKIKADCLAWRKH